MGRRLLVATLVLLPLSLASLAGQTPGIREVTVSERSVIPLNTKIRYTTMVVLPDGEEILDVICGDRDFWVVSAVQNVAHVKPAKAGAETNLNLVTARGTIYSFLLTEKSGTSAPDLKLYVNASEPSLGSTQKYYSAAEVARIQAETSEAKNAAERAEQRAAETVALERQQYPTRLRFVYGTLK